MADLEGYLEDRVMGRATMLSSVMRQAIEDWAAKWLAKNYGTKSVTAIVSELQLAMADKMVPLAELMADTNVAGWVLSASSIANRLPVSVTADLVERSFRSAEAQKVVPVSDMIKVGKAKKVLFPQIERGIEALQSRNLVPAPTMRWLEGEARANAYQTMNITNLQTLAKVRDKLATAVDQGWTKRQWKQSLDGIFDTTAIAENRIDLAFRDIVTTSYSEGREAMHRQPIVQAAMPYAGYRATDDGRTRPEHQMLESLGLNGTHIYRADDPVWRWFTPPHDFNCRCSKVYYTIRQAARHGVEEAIQWRDTGKPPENPEYRYLAIPFWGPPESGYVGPGFKVPVAPH